MNISEYEIKLGQMKTTRSNYDNYWQEIADYTFPKRDFTTERTEGSKRMSKIYDSTAIYATEQLAAGLHGMLTPPSSKWFFLKSQKINVNDEELAWLDGATKYLTHTFSSPESSFPTSVYELYLDVVAFGNAVMAVVAGNGKINFITKKLSTAYILENDEGVVDTLYLVEKMSPYNMIRKFGIENVDEKVVKAYKENQDVKFEILHAIEPRKINKGRGASKELKPFKSCFVDMTNKKLILEEGFDDFPFLFPRWSKRSGEVYGYGAGAVALAEAKELNRIAEIMTRAAAKNVDPPILSPAEGLILPMRLDPAGINFYNPDLGKPEFWQNGFQPNYFENLMEYKRQLINKMYYIDWMNLPQIDRQTTVEVMQRATEGQRMMSPMLSRLQSEFLSKLIRRTLFLAIDNDFIPKPPPSLFDTELSVEYTSPMSIAQRANSAQSVLQGLTVMANLAQYDPSISMLINSKNIAKDQALNTYAWPSNYLKTDEEFEEQVQAAQQQQSEMAQAQTMESYSKSANNVAGAMKDLQGG